MVVIGAGSIGRLIASEALLGGLHVHVIDTKPEALEGARRAITTTVGQALKEPQAVQRVVDRLHLRAGDLRADPEIHASLANARCVVEALPEVKELKESILGELDALVPPHTPITTVSSSFPVRELLAKVNFSGRFINTHPLQTGIAALEVMPSALTTPEITGAVSTLFHEIGMVPVHVERENVGFIFNIAWRNIKKTALDLVERGVCSPKDFDRIWMMAFKTKSGPFGVMDLVGLDVVLAIEQRYAKLTGKEEDAPPSFLRAMVEQGELGVKSGRGFYSYPAPEYRRPGFIESVLPTHSEDITPIRDTLIGAWELVSCTATRLGDPETLYPLGRNARGKLIYSAEGEMSVALIRDNREPFASPDPFGGTQEERARAFSEYFGYVGRFRYRAGVVFHDVEHCSFPNWSGVTLTRTASLDDQGYLTLSTPPSEVGGAVTVQRLVWKRLG